MHIKQILPRIRKKQILIGILCALLFLSPTILALIHIYRADHKVSNQELTVILYDSEDNEMGRETGTPALSDEASLVSIFSQLEHLKDPVSSLSLAELPETYVRAVLLKGNNQQEYTCYFSISDSSGICLDQSGNAFSIDHDLNRRFIGTSYGEIFFPSATPPTLLTIDGDTVLPAEAVWNYKIQPDVFLQAQRELSRSTNALYEITGELGLEFSKDPDQCVVTVWENGTVIFQDFHTRLTELTVNTGNVLDVHISANWRKTPYADSYGQMSYSFRVRIKNPSEFSLSTQTVRPGGIVALSCTNVTEPKKIQFVSESLPAPAAFYRDGALYRAFLIIPEDAEGEELGFRISYGASAQEFTLKLDEKSAPEEFQYPLLDLSDSPLAHMDGLAYLKSEFQQMNSLFDSDMIYFQGNNEDPSKGDFTVGYSHGSTVYWGDDPTDFFIAAGTEYLTKSDAPQGVHAWGNGVVIKAGTDDLLGNYVIVDHGGGILTWYGHLSIVSVSRGTVVRQNEILGQTGEGGLATGNGYLFLCSVHDQFMDPRILFDGSV